MLRAFPSDRRALWLGASSLVTGAEAKNAGGNARRDRKRRNRARDHRTRADNRAVADGDAIEDNDVGPDPDAVADHDTAILAGLLRNRKVGIAECVRAWYDADAGRDYHVVANTQAALPEQVAKIADTAPLTDNDLPADRLDNREPRDRGVVVNRDGTGAIGYQRRAAQELNARAKKKMTGPDKLTQRLDIRRIATCAQVGKPFAAHALTQKAERFADQANKAVHNKQRRETWGLLVIRGDKEAP